MTSPRALVALPVDPALYQQVQQLNVKFKSGSKEPLSADAGRVMSEVSCSIMDVVFGQLISTMATHHPQGKYQEAQDTQQEIKAVMRKYLPWATGFFANDRLAPAALHYEQMFIEKTDATGQTITYLAYALPDDLAQESERTLNALAQNQVKSAREAIETLIKVIEVGLQPLLYTPKKMMKFNFVADKTLNGVISVTNALSFRQLRKLADQIDPVLFTPVANHLQQFIISA